MLNLLTLAIALSTAISVFYYWATAKNRWHYAAYLGAVFNGVLLAWVNWVLAGTNRVPEIGLPGADWVGVEWTSNTAATNLFTILCIWMIISGFQGLRRLRQGRSK
jgi:hypothetical protein